MRFILVGASTLAVGTAERLIAAGREVVFVERDPDRVAKLAEALDCAIVTGDAIRPATLRQVGPDDRDALVCLTNEDQTNILVALLGRSLGFGRAILRVADADLAPLCRSLGLDEIIVPDQGMAEALAGRLAGSGLSAGVDSILTGNSRLFEIAVDAAHVGPIAELDLPDDVVPACLFRDEAPTQIEADTVLRQGDRLLIVTPATLLDSLRRQFPTAAKRRLERG
jgi:trk system potassium uptake protein TrkA